MGNYIGAYRRSRTGSAPGTIGAYHWQKTWAQQNSIGAFADGGLNDIGAYEAAGATSTQYLQSLSGLVTPTGSLSNTVSFKRALTGSVLFTGVLATLFLCFGVVERRVALLLCKKTNLLRRLARNLHN